MLLPSVLWHCWLGDRKSVRPVKIERWGVGVVVCLERGADCLHNYGPADATAIPKPPSSLASFKSRLALPFWYRPAQVVVGKRPWNGCSSGCKLVCAVDCSSGSLQLLCDGLKLMRAASPQSVGVQVNVKHWPFDICTQLCQQSTE